MLKSHSLDFKSIYLLANLNKAKKPTEILPQSGPEFKNPEEQHFQVDPETSQSPPLLHVLP